MIFGFCGPSGCGKSTVIKELRVLDPKLRFSVSHTTRTRRPQEVDGVDYHFVTNETFLSMVNEGKFLESAEVHGNHYGTAISEILPALSDNEDIILDIDSQGMEHLKKLGLPRTYFIFLLPPSYDEVERRIRSRAGGESEEEIGRRLINAQKEMDKAARCDFWLVNDNLKETVLTLFNLIPMLRAGASPDFKKYRHPKVLEDALATFHRIS